MARNDKDIEDIYPPTIRRHYKDKTTFTYYVTIQVRKSSFRGQSFRNRAPAYIYYGTAALKHTILVLLYKPWPYRWFARPVGYLLSKREREEWFGDLLEIQARMVNEERYPIFFINMIITAKTFLLIGSKASCVVIDVFSKAID